MGFFTVPLARRVGPNGQIYCVDVQPRMLSALEQRVRRLGLRERVVIRQCSEVDLCVSDLTGSIDLAVLIHVLHEVDDPRRALGEVIATLRPNGRLLLIEPKGHVKPELFSAEVALAREFGMVLCTRPAALERYRGLIELMKR
jgi:ubiquinone/menaquinone biosynthesis C-methylase UbiE